MSFHKKIWPVIEENPCPSDEMDALVRWALQDSVAGEEPPPEIWHKIKARLEQPKAQFCPRRTRLLSSAQFSLLVQLLMLGIIILVVFGFSLSQGFDLSLDREYVVNSEQTPQPDDSEEVIRPSTNDALSGYYLFQLSKELTIFDYRLAP